MRRHLQILAAALIFCVGCATNPFIAFQEDADLVRLEHLAYWTGLIEAYHAQKGSYPFQDSLPSEEDIALVKIATKQQIQYLSPGSDKYNSGFDINHSRRFNDISIRDFVVELESVLGREIDEHYDIQKVPTESPVGYNYFVTSTGYVFWVPCTSCGVTQVSTLLLDGYTPTVNIVSQGMFGEVTKALVREQMLTHPTYRQWISRPYHKEAYVRSVVAENIHDSKR